MPAAPLLIAFLAHLAPGSGNAPAAGAPAGESSIPSAWRSVPPPLLPESVSSPSDLCVDPLGRLLVLDGSSGRIWVLSSDRPAVPFGASDQGSGRFEIPTRVFSRWGLHVYTLDPQSRRVSVFDLEGRYESTFDLEESLLAGGGPADVELADFVVDKDGSLIVLDRLGGRLLLFDNSGGFRGLLGEDLTGSERLVAPSDLEVDETGNLYIADPPSGKLIRIGRQGSLGWVFDLRGSGGGPGRPVALAHAAGVLYVADAGKDRILAVSPSGGSPAEIVAGAGAGAGSAASALDVSASARLAMSPEGALLLLHPAERRLRAYRLQDASAGR